MALPAAGLCARALCAARGRAGAARGRRLLQQGSAVFLAGVASSLAEKCKKLLRTGAFEAAKIGQDDLRPSRGGGGVGGRCPFLQLVEFWGQTLFRNFFSLLGCLLLSNFKLSNAHPSTRCTWSTATELRFRQK